MKYPCYFLLILLLACKGSSRKSVPEWGTNQKFIDTITIDNVFGKVPPDNSLLSLIDSAFIIPLDNNPECIISEVSRIMFANEMIFILDKKQNTIFSFTKDGHFKFKIFKRGKGPGEYLSLYDFTLYNDEIVVLDNHGRKIQAYTYNGTATWSIKLPRISPINIAYVGNNFFYINCHYSNKQYAKNLTNSLIKVHRIKGVVGKYFPYSDYFGEKHNFTKNHYMSTGENGEVYYSKFYDEIAYRLTLDSVIAEKMLNIKGCPIEKDKPYDFYEKRDEFDAHPTFAYIEDYIQNNRNGYYYISYRYGNGIIKIFVNTSNGMQLFTANSNWKFEPSFYCYVLFATSPVTVDDGYFVSTLFPYNWLAFTKPIIKACIDGGIKDMDNIFKEKELAAFLNTLKKTDNPIIVKYKLR